MQTRQRPEAVTLGFQLWLGLIAFEVIHQVFNVVLGLFSIPEAKEQAKETMSPEQLALLSDQTLDVVVIGSLLFSAMLSLAIIALIGVTAKMFHGGGQRAEQARRFLTVFAIYFAIRGIIVFELSQTATVPIAILLIDGAIQLIIAVIAVLAAVLGGKKESVEWARAELAK